jgi:hypothetical protein
LKLQSRPGKTGVITLLSLTAAVVCFGLLSSSGVIENGVVKLGGAFAGFIVTVFALNKVWGTDERLDAQAEKENKPFVFEEVVKALDLRKASPYNHDQFAPLTDYYLARRVIEQHELEMKYATTSDGINWEGSSTHPASARWLPLKHPSHTGAEGQVLKHEYQVKLDLGELAIGESTPIINNIVYLNAFKNTDKEWLETHIDKPTGRLTMFVLAPEDMQITSASGGKSIGRDELEPITEPAVMQKGSLLYWSIEGPLLGARYAISWTWSRRVAPISQAAP